MIGSRGNQEYHLTMKDGYCMIAILVLYAILSFFNLGADKNPQTFWIAGKAGERVVLDLGNEVSVGKMRLFTGVRFGNFDIYVSNDNNTFTKLDELKEEKVFAWQDMPLDRSFRYMAIESITKEGTTQLGSIGEIGFYDQEGKLLPVSGTTELAELIVDEQNVVPANINYLNSTYFDEIYHARTAYEYIHGMTIYEWTHPPLGKLIMTLPIRVGGMTPFNYRLMGNIAGLCMLLVIYVFGKRVFKNTRYAAIAMGLFALDGMHFVQTRIATVDSYLVLFILLAYLFMYQYTCCNSETEKVKMHLNLLASGFFMGAAISTKWNGAYTAVGLAIIFFANFIERNRNRRFISDWDHTRIGIFLACFVYFIVIPGLMYVACYIPDMRINPKYATVDGFIGLQKQMYDYHSRLTATHPFSSKWYMWPFGIKPVWYYDGHLQGNSVSTIVVHSNPFIWWTGILAMIYTFIKAVFDQSKRYVFITITILAAFLPYVFIPRVMFLYHYFPVVPFMILTIVGALKDFEEETEMKWSKGYVIIAAAVFAFFYPIYSGLTIPRWYAVITQWIPGAWHFFN